MEIDNAATPHGEGSSRKLGRSDMILIDAGGKWGGYTADVTRVSLSLELVYEEADEPDILSQRVKDPASTQRSMGDGP
jgi:hypothetical protein